ncbi:Gp49 family protein [Silvimonas sp.]|uniref:Gp49 family protein n=1 Tax=Silvimonas sp. TaxID=2650811 RepID=UPI00283C97A2|nr:Gp49 family protein [Silvimonas sp.]MDR3429674.1 Gp49 family protein [Silvimonas sp.]
MTRPDAGFTDEQALEEQIQAHGLTAPRITPEQIDAQIVREDYHRFPDTTVTIALLTLRNGYAVTGESACVSSDNFNATLGRDIARRNAREKIWPLMGYALRDQQLRDSAKRRGHPH